jgi:predicted P-loop ATPase
VSNFSQYLSQRGLNEDIARLEGVLDLSPEQTAEIVGDHTKGIYHWSNRPKHKAAIGFEYRNPADHKEVIKTRVRYYEPRVYVDEATGKEKRQRYSGKKGEQNNLYFPKVFTEALLNDHRKPIAITEGEAKALSVTHNLGLPCVGLAGVWNWRTKDKQPIPDLSLIEWLGRQVTVIFDNDVWINRHVMFARMVLCNWLQRSGSLVKIVHIPPGPDKGIDDYFVRHGKAKTEKLLTEAPLWESEPDEEDKKAKLINLLNWVGAKVRPYLRWNELTSEITLGGQACGKDEIYLELQLGLGHPLKPKDDVQAMILRTAKENSYHPVRDYLERLPEGDTRIFEGLGKLLLGTDDPMHDTYLSKMMISAVARAMQPGCKVDETLILKGEQGIKKSTFFENLFGIDFFMDSKVDIADKDSLMKLHRCWSAEFGEIEQVTTKKGVSELKAFLTVKKDMFRRPYERETKAEARGFILVGSSNRDDFLRDESGNRRFWIIQAVKSDAELVLEMRDRLWAAALTAYREGWQWWLTDSEVKINDENNKAYLNQDEWTYTLLKWVAGKTELNIRDFLVSEQGLGMEESRITRVESLRVAAILKINGWTNKTVWEGDKAIKKWIKEEAPLTKPLHVPTAQEWNILTEHALH